MAQAIILILQSSHVIPALMRKAHMPRNENGDKDMTIWGSGSPRREFLHVDDAADALVHLMTHYSGEQHMSMSALAQT